MDIFKDMGIGIPSGLNSTDKTTLINLANTAQANNDSIKGNLVTSLNSKFGSTLTNANTWTDINNTISGLVPRKYYTTTIASGAITYGVPYSTVVNYNISLSFTPKSVHVVWYYGDQSANGVYSASAVTDSLGRSSNNSNVGCGNGSYLGYAYCKPVIVANGIQLQLWQTCGSDRSFATPQLVIEAYA